MLSVFSLFRPVGRSARLAREAELTAKGRKHIAPDNFALPGKRYPIHDISHARNALARVAQNGTPEEQKKVRSAVYRKYPSLKKGGESASGHAPQFREAGQLMDSAPTLANILEGPRVKAILISEGLGNQRNMNYYGPEAIASAPRAFEGKPCYLNHQSLDEEHNLPERTVQAKCGYFKNLHVETLADGKKACVGELHFDLSESGREAYHKAMTAIHYQKEFNGQGDYVGLSVASDGEAEPRDMIINGEEMAVNYVTAFTEADSCDLVTSPARGGRILALIEDKNGALRAPTREGRMNIKKKLLAALAVLTEAIKPDAADKEKKLAEAHKEITALAGLIEADGGKKSDSFDAMLGKREDESTEDHKKRLNGLKDSLTSHLQDYADKDGEDEDEDEAEAPSYEDEDESKGKGKKEDEAKKESRRAKVLAIKHMIAEAKIPDWVFSDEDVIDLSKLSLKEAEKNIKRQARLIKAQNVHVPSGSGGRSLESGSDDKSSTDELVSYFEESGR